MTEFAICHFLAVFLTAFLISFATPSSTGAN
jgi:hypothetical protein